MEVIFIIFIIFKFLLLFQINDNAWYIKNQTRAKRNDKV